MSRAYKIRDQSKPYFVTLTVVQWVDVFTRWEFCEKILTSLQYCRIHKGLIIHAWVIMTNHMHLIIGSSGDPMQNILRDFKSFTSREMKFFIRKLGRESRRRWMIPLFEKAGIANGNNNEWQFWQQHNHPIELWSDNIINIKLRYIHNNPVKARIVTHPEHFFWSSARDYKGMPGPIVVDLL